MMVLLVLLLSTPPTPNAAEAVTIFSHAEHLAREKGATCVSCHDPRSEAAPIKVARCVFCHNEFLPKHRLKHRARALRVEFPHVKHASTMPCEPCHQRAMADAQRASTAQMPPDPCLACHAESRVPAPVARCTSCHESNMRVARPADHEAGWKTLHGAAAQWRAVATHGQDCRLCHRQDACITCHRTERPQSHTGLWRVRTHGTSAAFDRDACKTCHQTRQCSSCHARTTPLNHKGAWVSRHGLAAASQADEHCAACHRLSFCRSCHERNRP